MTNLYARLAEQIQQLIRDGVYRDGERLPGVRVLSRQFGVSVSTVLQAHQSLESQGFLEARERSGFYARLPRQNAPVPLMRRTDASPMPVTARDMTLDLCSQDQSHLVPLAAAVPHADCLPRRQIQHATIWAARHGLESLDYAFPGKQTYLRQLAQRMTNLGVVATANDIIATNGAQEAIILALRAVTSPGDVVAVESPSFPGILQALEVAGLRVLEIPTHPVDGISLEGLELALEQWPVRACVVVANNSNPLGVSLSDERKRRLVRLMADAGVPLIEDDIYGDLSHNGERPRPLKAFDTSDSVIYCSSFSKTISPGLRAGWALPGRYYKAFSQQKYLSNLASASIPQLAVAHFLEQGGYDRYLRGARQRYREMTGRMATAISRAFPPGTAVSQPSGGFVVWVQLPSGLSGTRLFQRAREAGINIAPGRMFSTTDKYEDCIRLNAANPWSEVVETSVYKLGDIAAGLVPQDAPTDPVNPAIAQPWAREIFG